MSKGLKEHQILVIIKEPGKAAYVEPLFENTLESFQKQVGGYIETFTFAKDATLICNEEGVLEGLPFNATILGNDFYGTVVCVGVKGEEFASLKAAHVPLLLEMMNGH